MEPEVLRGWLRLSCTPGVGPRSARRLLAAFGPPESVFGQPEVAWDRVVGPALGAALGRAPEELDTQVATTLDWLGTGGDAGGVRRVLTLADAAYPQALLQTADPPLLLYSLGGPQGHIEDAAVTAWFRHSCGEGIAIVGSRNPTPQGLDNARAFAQALSRAGRTIVSGLAIGIDGAAHAGALDAWTARDRAATVAVVGTGLDRVYPRSHQALAHRIARDGLLLSEYPIGTPPLAPNFPRRNRLIAALAKGTLVVEAALRSGSLITARLAVEMGREVFAIPGSIHSTQSRGCHALIRQGAKLVESAHDVLEELGAPVTLQPDGPIARSSEGPATEDDCLLDALGFDPVGLDALQARCGLPTPRLQARLLALELDGTVARLPGGLFQRRMTG